MLLDVYGNGLWLWEIVIDGWERGKGVSYRMGNEGWKGGGEEGRI